MSIADYTDLLVQVSDYTARDDFAQNFPRFVSYAENKLNRRLRVAQMEVIDSIITDTDGAATLPTDYLEMREVLNASGVVLELSPVKALDEYFGPYSGTSARYSIVNNAFFAVPKSSHEFTITYYGKIPALTATNTTNWMLTDCPMIYLYGVCAEVLGWALATGREADATKLAAMNGMLNSEVEQLMAADHSARYSNARVLMSGVNP